jgi:hypothetical protein
MKVIWSAWTKRLPWYTQLKLRLCWLLAPGGWICQYIDDDEAVWDAEEE